MCSVTEGSIRDRTRFLLGWDQSNMNQCDSQPSVMKINRQKHSNAYQPYPEAWQRYRKTSESSNSTYSDYSQPSPSNTPTCSTQEYGLYSPGTSTESLYRRIEHTTPQAGQNQFRKLVDTISDALECEDLEKRCYFLSHEAEAILYGNTRIFESLSINSTSSTVPDDLAEVDVSPFRALMSQTSPPRNQYPHLIRALSK